MNICIKKYKVFIISICLVTMFSFSYCSQRAFANPLAAYVAVEGGTVATSALLGLVGVSLVAGGAYIAQNVDSTDIQYIAQGLVETGHSATALSVKVDSAGNRFLTWTADGWNYFTNKVSDIVDGYSISGSSFGSGSFTFSSLRSAGNNVPLSSKIFASHGQNIVAVFHLSDGRVFTRSETATSSLGYYYVTAYADPYDISVRLYDFAGNVICNVGNLGQSITGLTCDVSIDGVSSLTHYPSTGISSFSPSNASDILSTGVNSENTKSVDNYGIPLDSAVDSTGADVLNTGAGFAFPYGQSWGDISGDLGITYPTPNTGTIPGDTTGNPAIPGDTTSNPSIPGDTAGTIDTGKGILDIPILGDILKVLQKILDFLGTLIGSLVTVLINALEQLLTKLFVPTASMFNDFYSDIEDNVKSKFPYSVSILNSLKVNADEFKDIHVTIWGHDCVIVSAQFVNDNISWIRVVTSCFWIFSLFVYVWRKINAVLSGGDVNSTTVYAPGGGGSGPPSVI